ncbi:MAG: bifunctional folylpolyglutamate synthase/dihydrofolate synthase [Chthoniobacterales bacterium]
MPPSLESGLEPRTSYREALAWLFRTQRFGIKLGLENSRRLFAALEVPSPNERIIHVAGTNGKGSTCALLDSVTRAAGYRTGLFTSPHLITFRERIQVNGKLITEEEAARGLAKIRELVANWQPHPTFFEITTALALDHFRNHEVEIVVLETGMGGRLDATNATQSVVSVLTPIDYDHQKWLGDTLTKIAFEKAGIIKHKVPVVSALQAGEAAAVIHARAKECEAPLDFVRQPFDRFPVALSGTHQRENAALALSALHTARIKVDDAAIERGLTNVNWPARFQRWDARTVIDGAHNPAGARILAETWRQVFGDRRATVILAVLQDKDVQGICHALAPIMQRALLPTIQSERALAAEELRLTICDQFPGLPVATSSSFAVAWEEARRDPAPILVCGSLHFAGEALAFLRGEPAAFEECLQ